MTKGPIYLSNTLTKTKEVFSPLSPNAVTMYVCGPTVYDDIHIGNARACVVYDVLYRILTKLYPKVVFVQNITDLDDKINNRAKEEGISITALTTRTIKAFHGITSYLNCLSPTYEPLATQHVDEMITITQSLLEQGKAYIAADGVYYDVSKCQDYYKLSCKKPDELEAGVRIEASQHKHNQFDFVLWKTVAEDDVDPSSVFESPWGVGRPGWHTECCAMSRKYLGKDFDIHGGGMDLCFPHHTNEIAISKADSDSSYARYWVHNGFVTVEGEKMSKSLGNFITVKEIQEKGIEGNALRYLFLNTHYKKPIDFNENALHEARIRVDYLKRAAKSIVLTDEMPYPEIMSEFWRFLCDDMNTHDALALLNNIAKNVFKTQRPENKGKYCATLNACLIDLGMKFDEEMLLDPEIEALLKKRKVARLNKDWAVSDAIRDELMGQGITIEDKLDGTTISRKR